MAYSPNELFSLEGKTALVTGASSGIGYAFSLQLAKAGANVVVAARRMDRLNALVQEISKLGGGKAHALKLDVSAPEEEISRAVEEGWGAFGRIDILVNNAGAPAFGPIHQCTLEDFNQVFGVNVRGVWLVSKAVTQKMVKDKKGGSIINNSSILGLDSSAYPGTGLYAATKAAVIQLTLAQARDLGQYGIRSNAILPGLFPSEMSEAWIHDEATQNFAKENIPVQRLGITEKDMHGVLLLLASDASAYITGGQFVIDGGQTISPKPFI